MHVPWMKVAIYLLTFVGYCYSGYGSSILSGLRDAILTSETLFSDVFKNFITLTDKFKTVHEIFDSAIDENCEFKCSGTNAKPKPNKNYIATSDGCGALGLKINKAYLPGEEMENCCNAHDLCYGTCLADKELCDLDFKRCLYKFCDSYEKTQAGEMLVKGCKAASKVLFTGTLTLGCKCYLDAQANSCYCGSSPNTNDQKGSSSNNNNNNNNNNKQNEYNQNQKNYKKSKENSKKFGWKTGSEL